MRILNLYADAGGERTSRAADTVSAARCSYPGQVWLPAFADMTIIGTGTKSVQFAPLEDALAGRR